MSAHILDAKLFIGKKFNFWTILDYHPGIRKDGKKFPALVTARCDCGKEKKVIFNWVRNETSKSCGCRVRESGNEMIDTSEYSAWLQMRYRCNNKNYIQYYLYGGRGIKVCESWSKFSNFIKDMGPKPGKLYSLDRKNNDGNYEKSNCRWATQSQQNSNKRHRRSGIFKKCLFCEKDFYLILTRINRKFCSRKCWKDHLDVKS